MWSLIFEAQRLWLSVFGSSVYGFRILIFNEFSAQRGGRARGFVSVSFRVRFGLARSASCEVVRQLLIIGQEDVSVRTGASVVPKKRGFSPEFAE